MSSDKTLETLKVVIDGDAKPLKKEVKDIRKELDSMNRNMDLGRELRKSMNKSMEPMRKFREQSRKMYAGIMDAFKLPDGDVNENAFTKRAEMMKKIREASQSSYASVMKAFKMPDGDSDETSKKMDAIRKVWDDMKKRQGALRDAVQSTSSNTGMKNLQKEIDTAEKKLRKLIATRDELETTGGDMELTQEYRELTTAVDQAEKKLNSLMAKQEKYLATGGKTNTSTWKKLQYDIEEADNSLKAMKADMNGFSEAEKYQDTAKYKKVGEEISRTRIELAQLSAQQKEYESIAGSTGKASSFFKKAQSGIKGVSGEIKKVSGAFAALIQKFKTGIPLFGKTQKSMNGIGNTGKGLSGMFKTLGMTAKFMFASFAIMGTINMAKEGMQNLAKYSNIYGTKFNTSMTSMYSALKQLQNALATAFEPIVNVVAPYITKFVGYLTDGANALAQFFSALTGSSTWTKATYNTQNYADSLDDATSSAAALNRELYSFDEINKQSDSSSSGSGLSAGSMFDTETVSNQFADFAQLVKDAWSKADFTGIGAMVGSKLNTELEEIDWTAIKETTAGIASSIATFLNGFIETTNWDLVGSTIAEGVNTAVLGINTFLTKFNWGKAGKAIASTLNGFIKTADWSGAGKAVSNGINALFKLAETWSGKFKFGVLGNSVGKAVNSAVKGIKWGDALTAATNIGSGIATTINDFLKTTDFTALGSTVANGIKTAINAWYGFVTTFDFDDLGTKIKDTLKGFFNTMNEVDKKTGLSGWQKMGKSLSDFASGISSALTKALDDDKMWNSFGQSVGDFITAIDWGKITIDLGNLAMAILTALGNAFKGLGDSIGEYIWDLITGDEKGSDADLTSISGRLKNSFTGQYSKEEELLLSGTTNLDDAKKTRDIYKKIGDTNSSNAWDKAISTYNIKVGISTDKKQAQKDVNKTTSYVSNSSNTNPVKTGVTTDSEKTAKSLYAGVQKEFSKYTISTAAKTSNSGTDLRKTLQSKFSLASLFTAAKTTNSGNSLRKTLQSTFGLKSLSTTAKTSNTGSAVWKTVQDKFGLKSLFTAAKVTNSGNSLREGLQPGFGQTALSTGVSLPDGAAAFDNFNNQWNSKTPTLFADLKVGIGKNLNGVNSLSQTTLDLLINGKASGGIFSGGEWKPVTAYAGGGTPASAQLFMAREAGPELVGTIGNHTAVVNNDQIVASVASGVYRAVASAMMASNASNSQSSQPTLNVYVGGKQITDYVIKDVNNRTIATGKCPITT